jgi:hypothetical protein
MMARQEATRRRRRRRCRGLALFTPTLPAWQPGQPDRVVFTGTAYPRSRPAVTAQSGGIGGSRIGPVQEPTPIAG